MSWYHDDIRYRAFVDSVIEHVWHFNHSVQEPIPCARCGRLMAKGEQCQKAYFGFLSQPATCAAFVFHVRCHAMEIL